MEEEFRKRGLERCFVEGTLRWNSGKIEEGRWLIIGTEGSSGLALQGDKRLIHLPQQGYFLRASLKPTGKKWEQVLLKGIGKIDQKCFFMDKGKWYMAEPGDMVWGYAIGEEYIKLFHYE